MSEALGDDVDNGHRAVVRDRQDGVDCVPPRQAFHRVRVVDVGHLGDIRVGEARCLGIGVDDDDAMSESAQLQDRGTLVAVRADDEDCGHGAMLDEPSSAAHAVTRSRRTRPSVTARGRLDV